MSTIGQFTGWLFLPQDCSQSFCAGVRSYNVWLVRIVVDQTRYLLDFIVLFSNAPMCSFVHCLSFFLNSFPIIYVWFERLLMIFDSYCLVSKSDYLSFFSFLMSFMINTLSWNALISHWSILCHNHSIFDLNYSDSIQLSLNPTVFNLFRSSINAYKCFCLDYSWPQSIIQPTGVFVFKCLFNFVLNYGWYVCDCTDFLLFRQL